MESSAGAVEERGQGDGGGGGEEGGDGGEEGSGRRKSRFSRRNRIVNGLGFYTFCGFEGVSF